MTGNRTTRYDYIMADGAMAARLTQCWVADEIQGVEGASDHYPLVAAFNI